MTEKKTEETIAPVRKAVIVHRTVEDAFHVFTEQVAIWWPLDTYSVGEHSSDTCEIEGRVGGRFYERLNDGTEVLWGEILQWNPPNHLAFTWHPGREPDSAQTVEVTFTSIDEGTRVELTHSGWEKLGARALETRDSYDSGWEFVLGERYVACCEQEVTL